MKCTNCGTTFGCSCKKRQASNGTACCQSCITEYENSLNAKKVKQPVNKLSPTNVTTSGSINK